MILPDVNVLVHAFRSDSADHSLCRTWLDGVINGHSRYAISPQVLSGVTRVATHSRAFRQPSSLGEALRFCEVLLSQPHCVVIQPDRGTGICSPNCAGKPMLEATSYPMRGSPRWPLRPAASGLPWTTNTPAFPVCAGGFSNRQQRRTPSRNPAGRFGLQGESEAVPPAESA